MQHSGDGLALPAHIDNQHHRSIEKLGDLPGGATRRRTELLVDTAVEKTHHTLDHGDIGISRTMPVERADQILTHQDRVEVAARPTGRQSVVARIDEVGSDLERRNPMPRAA